MNMKIRLLAGLLIAVVYSTVAAAPVQASQESNFTAGTATATALSSCSADPGGVPGNCWGLNVSCPNITAFFPYDATVKVTAPSGQSLGTVIFITGGGGSLYYDSYFTYGAQVIDSVVDAGFTAVQIVFDNPVAGWLTGPAGDGNGPISLACLPATAMEWVYYNARTSDTPLCATGSSGGSAALAYALSQYGVGRFLTFAEPTSGPEFSRLDYGCSPPNQTSACAVCGSGTLSDSYGLPNAEAYVDPAYTGVASGQPNGPCSKGILSSQTYAALFHHDSILSDKYPPQLSFVTQVRVVFGGLDIGAAIPEGLDWVSFITSSTTVVCVPSAGHEIASFPAGAIQLENDLVSYCQLP
jgi:hypothetical protein